MDYLDFEIEIGPGQGREYSVALIRSPAGEARETMRFPFDELALENRLLALQNALLRSGGRRRQVLSREEQTVQDFGGELFKALLSGEIRNRYDVSRLQAQQQSKGLRLKLRFQSPELAALPWEFLFDVRRREYLSLSKDTPPIRYLELPQPILPLPVTPPLRVLGMVACPADLPKLDEDREKQRIEAAVKHLRDTGVMELEWLPGQSWRHLQKAMRHGPWHIFHFIGHGGFDPSCDEGCLAMVNDTGRQDPLKATQLASLLTGHHSLRLVLLNACESAKGSGRDIFSSTAAILVHSGVAAVLAMQYEITDRAAIEFSRVFYEALADGLPIDASVTEARIAVNIAVQNTLEWGTPVLYMRSPDGVLFELVSKPVKPLEPVIGEGTEEPQLPEPKPPEIRKGRLRVETEPQGARVTLLNFPGQFSQGMELEPGRYEVEATAEGFEPHLEWIELGAGEDRRLSLKLGPVIEEKAAPEVGAAKPVEVSQKARVTEPEAAAATPEATPETKLPPAPVKSRLPLIGAAVGLAVVLLLVGWWLFSGPSTRPIPAPSAEMKPFTNSIGMTFVLIPAGTFKMGSPAGELDRDDAERQHQVTISKPFYLQTTEMTQEQWQKVMGSNPSEFNSCGKDCPVEQVSWNDTQEFVKKLNQMENTDKYRLPTGAEWEYACRAKSTGRFSFGDDEARLKDYAWYSTNSASKTHPVGQLQPNAWSLYDMHGNVWEWCQDWYGPYPEKPVTDPKGPGSGMSRVLRGGSWYSNTRDLRSAGRGGNFPVDRNSFVGFRVARTF